MMGVVFQKPFQKLSFPTATSAGVDVGGAEDAHGG